jgi:two-component system, sensor histidine kinase ChiS
MPKSADKSDISEEFLQDAECELRRIRLNAAKFVSVIAPTLMVVFAFTGIDYIFSPEHWREFILIRIVSAAAMFGVHALSRVQRFEAHGDILSSATLIIGGAGIAIMVHMVGWEHPYYAGMNLVYLGTAMIPCGIKITLATCFVVYALYLVPILPKFAEGVDLRAFLNNSQFQLFTIAVAAAVNYLKDKNTRTQIYNRLTIAKQARDLEALDLFKREFIANITHELKTPLSIMIGNTDMMLERITDGETDPQVLTDNVRRMQQAAFQLANHVDRIIAVSSADDPEVKLNLDLYNFVALAQNVFDMFVPKAKEEQKAYQLIVPERPLVVRLDQVRAEEILINLVQNALKYTEEGGSVTVAVGSDGEHVFTEVIDTGVGIAADKLPSIFDRLFQADDVLSKRHGGMGIGLYIAKRNVELHGGAITVHSVEGKGTSFRFTLPLYADQTAQVRNLDYDGEDRRQGDRRTGDRRSGADRRAVERFRRWEYQQRLGVDELAKTTADVDFTGYENCKPDAPTVLIVEDNPGLMRVVVETLREDYNLLLAGSGVTALERLQFSGGRVSLILTDIMMPGMNGYEFCQKVMEREEWRRIPLIFVSALLSLDDQIRGFKLGAADYIIKPYNMRVLREKVNSWIVRRQYEALLRDMSASLETRVEQMARIKDIILHEVRNPVQVIMGANYFVEVAANEALQDGGEARREQLAHHLQMLKGGVESLNAVLETSRDIDVASLHRRPERLSDVLGDALKQTEHLRYNMQITVDTEALSEVTVSCHRSMVVQVLVNLLRNASEAIHERGAGTRDGVITVTHEPVAARRQVGLKIRDNGVGIPQDVQERLFRYKFTTKKNGTGVGLHLSKMIMKLHEGDIGLSSTPGEGTTFTVYLPLAPGAHAADFRIAAGAEEPLTAVAPGMRAS